MVGCAQLHLAFNLLSFALVFCGSLGSVWFEADWIENVEFHIKHSSQAAGEGKNCMLF